MTFHYQSFSYAYVKPKKEDVNIIVNYEWPEFKGILKTNTVLQYDEDYENVIAWGSKVLAGEPSRRGRARNNQPRPVELFKLHLGNIPESQKPYLPNGITPERAITDYLREMGN